jgi:hypothetical protein
MRLSYCIDPTDSPPELLDQLFHANYGIWGGRMNPIVPAPGGTVDESYWGLLRLADPDVVYAYTTLDGGLVERLCREIGPCQMEFHPRQKIPDLPPDYHPRATSSLVRSTALLPSLLNAFLHPVARPTIVTSRASWRWPHRRWFLRNFGLLEDNVWPRPYSEDVPRVSVDDDWDDVRLLRELAKLPYFVCPSAAAASNAKFPGAKFGASEGEYWLIVGDDTAAWLLFWNRVFCVTPYRRNRWHTLCVPPDRLLDAAFVDAMRAFLRTHLQRSGSHPPWLHIQSPTLEEGDLSAIADRLCQRLDVLPRPERVDASRSPLTLLSPVVPRYPDFEVEGLFEPSDVSEQQALGRTFLLHAPPSTVSVRDGTRVLELRIEYQPRYSFYSNEKLWWRLPKRHSLVRLFVTGHTGRIDATGSLSIELAGERAVELRVPSDNEVLIAALHDKQVDCAPVGVRPPRPLSYGFMQLSDKGRYVTGILELFGGLQPASRLVENSFWRGVVEHIGHRSPNKEADALTSIVNKLKKQRAELFSQLRGEERLHGFARYILDLARSQRTKEVDISWEWVCDRFLRHRKEAIKANPGLEEDDSPEGLEREPSRVLADLRQTLQWLVDARIFFQGVRFRCSRCGSAYWLEVSETRQETTCTGCRSIVSLRVEENWTYRLNSLVKSGVAQHGCLAVIWTLARLREEASTSFFYAPGLELYDQYEDETPAAELDLVCISDGRIVIGEVKTSADGFSEKELRTLGECAKRIRPDIIVLAAFRDPHKRLNQHAENLKGLFPNGEFEIRSFTPDASVTSPTLDALL